MAAFVMKDKEVILRQALRKLQQTTPITATGPGSVARSLTEVITTELGDFYSILDFNVAMSFVSTASGRALDLLGQLYNMQRKSLTTLATLDKSLGSFYFYIDQPFGSNIVIPKGTVVSTDSDSFIGNRYAYRTTEDAVIFIGRTRIFCSIAPTSTDSVFTAGINTLTQHDFTSPIGTVVKCTNPKAISSQDAQESDADFRTRIIKAVRTSPGGTQEALRFAGLAVGGVRDIRIRNAPYGLGSFEVLVVTEDVNLSERVVAAVTETLRKLRPIGCTMFIKQPELLTVEMDINATFKNVRNLDKPNFARRIKIAVLRFLNTLTVGEPMVYNKLIQSILDSVEVVSDISFTSLKVSGSEILRRNYIPDEDQQLIPGNINVLYTA